MKLKVNILGIFLISRVLYYFFAFLFLFLSIQYLKDTPKKKRASKDTIFRTFVVFARFARKWVVFIVCYFSCYRALLYALWCIIVCLSCNWSLLYRFSYRKKGHHVRFLQIRGMFKRAFSLIPCSITKSKLIIILSREACDRGKKDGTEDWK